MFTKMLQYLLGLCFDDPNTKKGEESAEFKGEDGLPDVKVDYDSLFKSKDDEKSDEEEDDETEEGEEDEEGEESEESEEESEEETEDEEDDEEEDEEENDQEEEEETEEGEEKPVDSKRLKDTQRALHRSEAKLKKEKKEKAEMLSRLEKLEKTAEKAEKKDDKSDELTLKTVQPAALAEFMKKDPVNAVRWITDQQSRLSYQAQKDAEDKSLSETAKQKEREEAEDLAFKQYPILNEVLELDEDDLEDMKESDPDKYSFASKVVKHYQRNLKRGDDDALLNAANRVYREMNPKQIKKLIKDAQKEAKKSFRHKKKVLGKVKTVSKGGKGKKSSGGFKSLSEQEFAALTPMQQDDYMLKSIDNRLASKK